MQQKQAIILKFDEFCGNNSSLYLYGNHNIITTANINLIKSSGQTNVQMDKSMSKWTNGQESPSILYRGDCPCLVHIFVQIDNSNLVHLLNKDKGEKAW
jgi:hypothetical protein